LVTLLVQPRPLDSRPCNLGHTPQPDVGKPDAACQSRVGQPSC
jgi:hypothetical protein